MTTGDRTTQAPISEWPRSALEDHKERLERQKAEIQGRIDAIDSVLEEREP